jgi:hypothetical protein
MFIMYVPVVQSQLYVEYSCLLPVSILRLQDKVRDPTWLGHGLVILPLPRKQNEFIKLHSLKKVGLQTVFKISSEKFIRKRHQNNQSM